MFYTKHSGVAYFTICYAFLFITNVKAQVGNYYAEKDKFRDSEWIMGYGPLPPIVDTLVGQFHIRFSSLNNTIFKDTIWHKVEMIYSNSSICDENGNLVLYSNGQSVGTKMYNRTMGNDSINLINRIDFEYEYPNGLFCPQGIISLPDYSNPNIYHLLYSTFGTCQTIGCIDSVGGKYVTHLLHAVFDKRLDNGIGDLTVKDEIIMQDTFTRNMQVCRHANGRDWWIIKKEQKSYGGNVFNEANEPTNYKFFLFDNTGIHFSHNCAVGNRYQMTIPNVFKFNRDGSKFVEVGRSGDGLEYVNITMYDFDRCTGLLSNAQYYKYFEDYDGWIGAEFSPNNRFLYVSHFKKIFQFDMEATDIFASRTLVATYDGFVDSTAYPRWVSYTYFGQMVLAPNNKIFVHAGNGFWMHSIDQPDLEGLACNVLQHNIKLPRYNSTWSSLPNFPHFRLGALTGSTCDTIPMPPPNGVGNFNTNESIRLFPNPSHQNTNIVFDTEFTGNVEITTNTGQIVFAQKYEAVTQIALNTEKFSNTNYIVKITSKNGNVTCLKLVIIH